MTKRTPPQCVCGATYEEHRLGMSFAEARRMLWDQPDPNRPGWYRQKRRHSVLGVLREMKIHTWHAIHDGCADRLGLAEAA